MKKVYMFGTLCDLIGAYGRKKIGTYYGNFGKWSNSVFSGSILMKLGFFCRLFPKSLHFLDKLGDNICPFKILIAVSSLQLPCTRGNFNFCEIIFPFSHFSRFIIFLIVNHSFLQFHNFLSLFLCKKKDHKCYDRFLK